MAPRGNSRHSIALLCGFGTPSLTAQGGQRLLPNSTVAGAIPFVALLVGLRGS
jgi:hypothetical protein